MKNPRNIIFIVDDDPDDRQVILDAFLENNFNIDYLFIENGDILMETLASSPTEELPSLILLDLNMPGMLGLQAIKEIKGNKSWKHIPIIVLTTSTLDKDRDSSYELGANCFLRKPESYTDLVTLTTSIIALWFSECKITV